MSYLLGIDVGTSGAKTALFKPDGRVVASKTLEYPMQQPQNGWAEQDPRDWWRAAVGGIQAVLADSGIDPAAIRGIGISGQMHSLVMLDGQNQVLRPAILWCDGRTAAECEEIYAAIGKERYLEITCNPALTGFTAGKILWVRKHEPEIYAKCRHILLPKDYIRLMLTGAYATEVSDASGMGLLDVPRRRWSDEVLGKLDIDKALLAEVYESPEVAGTVTAWAAAETGLAVGTVVVGGAGDNAAAAVGTGVVTDGKAFATIGTSGVVFAHTDKLSVDPQGRVHTFCCAVPGAWHVMGVTLAAGASLQWFRNNLCRDIMQDAAAQGVDPYNLMNHMAQAVPVGADRLLFLPYLMGERTPHLDPDSRGVFFGLSAIHTKAHLLRAVMEGVSYSLRDCNEILKEMGIRVDEMMACGGGGKSPVWRQMLADLYRCAVGTVEQTEGPALGVAILAGVGCGLYESVPAACERLVTKAESTGPYENAERYEAYHRLYDELYLALKDSYRKLADL